MKNLIKLNKEMKYAITGHTRGIGEAIYHKLSPNIIGFSRTNGYDINDPDSRARIIAEIQDCDVFINNAVSERGRGQVLIFQELYNLWKDLDKKIINVGSAISEVTLKPGDSRTMYRNVEVSLKWRTQRVQGLGRFKVEYKYFSYVSTPTQLIKNPNAKFISIEEAVNIILS